MGRTLGARNADYDEQRLKLARKLRQRFVADGGVGASLRELAAAADVSVSTLKHYFKDRDGLVAAVMEAMLADATPFLARAALPEGRSVEESLRGLLEGLMRAWEKFGVGAMHASGLAAGLGVRALGPAYVNYMLEPLLQTAETRIRVHVERGELSACNERFAAIELLAPVVLALLHQDSLSGVRCRPLDVPSFLTDHLRRFLAAVPPARGRSAGPVRRGA